MSYTWINPYGVIIATNDTIQVNISTGEDYGTYMCKAENSLGEDNATIDVLRLSMYDIFSLDTPIALS